MKEQNFGDYLRYLREQNGLGVCELAKLSEVSPSYISQIENGKRSVPQPQVLQRIAPHLGVGNYELMVRAGYFELTNEPLIIDDETTKILFTSLSESKKKLLLAVKDFDDEQILSIIHMIKKISRLGVKIDEK